MFKPRHCTPKPRHCTPKPWHCTPTLWCLGSGHSPARPAQAAAVPEPGAAADQPRRVEDGGCTAGQRQRGRTFREQTLMDAPAPGEGPAVPVSQLLCLSTTRAERAGHATAPRFGSSLGLSSLSTLPHGWEISPGLGFATCGGLARVLGSALWPLSRWSHNYFSQKRHKPLPSPLPRLSEQPEELHAARTPACLHRGTRPCTLQTPDKSVTFAAVDGR